MRLSHDSGPKSLVDGRNSIVVNLCHTVISYSSCSYVKLPEGIIHVFPIETETIPTSISSHS